MGGEEDRGDGVEGDDDREDACRTDFIGGVVPSVKVVRVGVDTGVEEVGDEE